MYGAICTMNIDQDRAKELWFHDDAHWTWYVFPPNMHDAPQAGEQTNKGERIKPE
jgi:hypothetical protein